MATTTPTAPKDEAAEEEVAADKGMEIVITVNNNNIRVVLVVLLIVVVHLQEHSTDVLQSHAPHGPTHTNNNSSNKVTITNHRHRPLVNRNWQH